MDAFQSSLIRSLLVSFLNYYTSNPVVMQIFWVTVLENKYCMHIDKDAFSSGQISSKVWLCKELEKLNHQSIETWIYGGWYATTAFLLLSRENYQVTRIRSFDADPTCEPIADMINENYLWQNAKFKAYTQDCNTIDEVYADCIINTSTEHFESNEWFENIPLGTLVVLQGNNMNHDDHESVCTSLEHFKCMYPLSETLYEGELEFTYPKWSFTRYMTIGRK